MDKKEKYYLRAENKMVAVEETVYTAYYKMERRERYLEESDLLHGKVSYHNLDTDDFSGEEMIPDMEIDVEEIVITRILLEKLRKCLVMLNEDERLFIKELYYNGKSETVVAGILGVSQQAVSKRIIKLLDKLHKLMKKI